MRRAMAYSVTQAIGSLRRRSRSAALAMLTIAAGLFVLGSFLVVNANLHQVMARWSEAAELSIYLQDDVSREQLQAIDQQVERSGLSAARHYVTKGDAASRFREDFPDLARASERLEHNPFPASFEVRLRPESRDTAAVDTLAAALASAPGVADVRYDRRLLSRLGVVIRAVNGVGLVLVILLATAAALTVASVVRLAVDARRQEIEIMQLVGAPLVYVRGPFVAEGVLQGGGGALLAIVALWVTVLVTRAHFGQIAADSLGLSTMTFLPLQLWLPMVAAGMVLGCIGGLMVAKSVV